jgi:catalase (peroxidase I)
MGTDKEPNRRAPVDPKVAQALVRCRMPRRVGHRLNATTDLSRRPVYERSPAGAMENPDQFADAFARAWFKRRTATWISRALSRPQGFARRLGWQTQFRGSETDWAWTLPHSRARYWLLGFLSRVGFNRLGLGVHLPWLRQAAARATPAFVCHRRRLGSQPAGPMAKVLKTLEGSGAAARAVRRQISLADLIVLGGLQPSRGGEKPTTVTVPFMPGRMDASQGRPTSGPSPCRTGCGWRNYQRPEPCRPRSCCSTGRNC